MARVQFALPARRVVQAYRAFAEGRAGIQDYELIAADIEAFGGFWEVTTPDTPDNQRAYAEGQRSVLGRIHALTRMSEAVFDQIEAAQQEKDID